MAKYELFHLPDSIVCYIKHSKLQYCDHTGFHFDLPDMPTGRSAAQWPQAIRQCFFGMFSVDLLYSLIANKPLPVPSA
jgi:hypothetical protein